MNAVYIFILFNDTGCLLWKAVRWCLRPLHETLHGLVMFISSVIHAGEMDAGWCAVAMTELESKLAIHQVVQAFL